MLFGTLSIVLLWLFEIAAAVLGFFGLTMFLDVWQIKTAPEYNMKSRVFSMALHPCGEPRKLTGQSNETQRWDTKFVEIKWNLGVGCYTQSQLFNSCIVCRTGSGE